MSCCGIKKTIARIQADAAGNPIIKEEDFVMVKYVGGNLQKHHVYSPSRVLQKQYGFRANHYGQHVHGDEFAIHRDDLKAAPKLFKEIKVKVEDAEDPASKKVDEKAAPADKPATKPNGTTTNKNK